MKDELLKLGFTKDEALVYLALLELGQSPAGPIVKKSGLHRQQVYDTLEKLKRKHFVAEAIKSNRKHWTASRPEEIIRQLKEKLVHSEQLLPDLLSLYKLSAHKQEVKVFEGFEGFKAVQQHNIMNQPKNTIVPVIGANTREWAAVMKKAHYLHTYEKKRIEKNISHHLIFFEKERQVTLDAIKRYFESKPQKHKRVYRYLPDEFQSPVGMQIWHDNITLIIYTEPVTCIQISNPLVVANFRKYFEFLWKAAKK